MLNIILIICEVIVAYIAMILLYKKYKTDGLITYTIIATIISNLMCLKKIDMLNTELPLGLGITMSILIAINIITQNKGKEEVNNFLVIILVSSLVSLCFFNLSGLIESADINKYANKSYDSIFTYNLRIYLANTITLLVTAFLSSRLYFMLKILKNKIILSNIFTIVIVEFIDNIIFMLIAYLFTMDTYNLILAIILRYIIKLIIGILGTIPILMTKKMIKE